MNCTPLSVSSLTPNWNSKQGIKKNLSLMIAKVLKTIFSKEYFCWISRSMIMLESYVSPQKCPYWNQLSDQIYVGGMPLKNLNHLEELSKLGISAVLSVNKNYEFTKKFFAEPINREDWQSSDIAFLKVSSPDLEPVKLKKLSKAVDFVVEQARLGKVYIHCIGGRGRSVSVAICSLAKIHGLTMEEAIQQVQNYRSQAMLTPNQMMSITAWFKENNV